MEADFMNMSQASNLAVAILSGFTVIALTFFAVTDSKSTLVFSIAAVFFALSGAFWVYQFAKGRRVS